MAWFSSTLTFTRRTLPPCARTTFSMMGVSCLQGPHQGAQKSTSTGTWREASMTSAMKERVSLSLIRESAFAMGGWPTLPDMLMNGLSIIPYLLPLAVSAIDGRSGGEIQRPALIGSWGATDR